MSVLQSGRRLIMAVACLMLLCSIMVSTEAMNRVDGERWAYRMDRFIPMAMQIDVNGQPYLYVAQKNGGLAVVNSSGRSAGQAVARLRINDFKGLDVTHLHQDGPFLYLSLGNFFNAAGSRHGMAIVDVSKPKRPSVRSVWVSDEITRGSSGIVVHDGVAYLGAMDQGVVALDITRPDRIRFLSLYQPDIHFPRRNPGRIQHPNARGLVIHEGTLYVAYDAGGLRVLDISNPNRMREIGHYLNPSAAARRKQQAYNNLLIHGSIAYIATDYCGMEIVDISNPGDIRQLGWWNEWSCDQASNNWFNSPGHTNQLILDDPPRGDLSLQW